MNHFTRIVVRAPNPIPTANFWALDEVGGHFTTVRATSLRQSEKDNCRGILLDPFVQIGGRLAFVVEPVKGKRLGR